MYTWLYQASLMPPGRLVAMCALLPIGCTVRLREASYQAGLSMTPNDATRSASARRIRCLPSVRCPQPPRPTRSTRRIRCLPSVHTLLGLPGVLGRFGAFRLSAAASHTLLGLPQLSVGPLQHTQSQPRLSGRSMYEAKAVYIYICIYMAALGCQSPVHHGSGFK